MNEPALFNRPALIQRLNEEKEWDILIIGGGATGLGIAVDAASRGYSTLLLEQYDFAKGTSSRSTKLVHGGVRYLAQGDIKLVYNALHEREFLLRNAAHLVKPQSFIIPCYSIWDTIKYSAGLRLYDLLAGSLTMGRSRFLKRKTVLERLPNINTTGLTGGIEYFDGQFDDARLALNLAQTSVENSAVVLNYFKVTGMHKRNGKITGVSATDTENNISYNINAKAVINATGVFVDDVLKMDDPHSKPLVRPSQGVHVVINKSFLQGKSALMIPKTSDGRVLFAVPWHEHVIVGTTDTPLREHSIEPVALKEEIQFILNTVKQYLVYTPHESDVLSVFAGLRPLAAPSNSTNKTKEISRDHKLMVSDSGLITITGGKWTTYRKMAEETLDKAIETAALKPVACKTTTLSLHGTGKISSSTHLSVYGSDEEKINALIKENPLLGQPLVNGHPYSEAEVVWAVRNEMARTVEDVLARRMRLLFLDARGAIAAAPRVAELMSKELGWNEETTSEQLSAFISLAGQYVLNTSVYKTINVQ